MSNGRGGQHHKANISCGTRTNSQPKETRFQTSQIKREVTQEYPTNNKIQKGHKNHYDKPTNVYLSEVQAFYF